MLSMPAVMPMVQAVDGKVVIIRSKGCSGREPV